MPSSDTWSALAVLWVLALLTLTGCDRQGFNRQPPPPPGASVHQSPANAPTPAPQGSVLVPPVTPDVPQKSSTP